LESHKRCFVFTKPATGVLFEGLGFKEIAHAEPLFSVLEFGHESIVDYQDYLRSIKVATKTDKVATIVVNCNPFTRGHQFLIEKAAAENEIVYLFVVESDLSAFPYEVRLKIIKEGIAHLKNVVILATGPYIVSGGIFPNYFLKLESWNLISEKQAEVDIQIFAKYIVPILEIKKRYVGTEQFCRTTRAYNKAMKEILPKVGCEIMEIERMAIGMISSGQYKNCISASKVRLAMRENKIDEVLQFIPEATKKYLLSPESKPIWDKIQKKGIN
jgi:[citrate (pro-3S)-lyase] ligase